MKLAERLAKSNLMYRQPGLYDHFSDSDHGVTTVLRKLFPDGPVGSVLDLGCGTGLHLAALQRAFDCGAVGVDVQPELIEYAQVTHPNVELLVGDLRSVRLGRQFDAVLCLGNSLSYQLTDDDLLAAAKTFAAHTRPGGHLVIVTMMRPLIGGGTSTLNDQLVSATVDSGSSWDGDTRIVTTTRTWRHHDGRVDEDHMQRRVTPLGELTGLLTGAGFTDVDAVERDQTFVTARRI